MYHVIYIFSRLHPKCATTVRCHVPWVFTISNIFVPQIITVTVCFFKWRCCCSQLVKVADSSAAVWLTSCRDSRCLLSATMWSEKSVDVIFEFKLYYSSQHKVEFVFATLTLSSSVISYRYLETLNHYNIVMENMCIVFLPSPLIITNQI